MRSIKAPPEDSVAIRVVAAVVVMISVGAVLAQGVTDAFTGIAAVVLPPAGFLFSHLQRHRPNRGTKVVLAVALLAAFGSFLQNVRYAQSVDEARTSLASLFLWVQVLHSFDVPRRRDLGFSVASSVILMAEAGSLSLDTSFVLFLVPWAGAMGAWLVLTARPRPDTIDPAEIVRHRSRNRGGHPRWAPARTAAVVLAALSLTACGAFLLTPRLPGAVVVTPPFQLGSGGSVSGFEGQVVNPGLNDPGGDDVSDFTANAYPGFGDTVDLRSRGTLSDDVVMKVRAQQPGLWRGEAFDVFDGTKWTIGDRRTVSTEAIGSGAQRVPWSDESSALAQRVVQTFYVQVREPNVVFGAWQPQEVYFPAGGLRVDNYGSIRAPILLDAGTIYSVVSHVPVVSAPELRSLPDAWPQESLERYTQLPAGLSSQVRTLAERITAGEDSAYDKVLAVQRWLRANTRYNLDVPREVPGADPIETFLFDRREGYCEHIASSMALLLRAVGVPTRLATGFGPGDRNTFTGYFEVKESDAHAWVEVLYPGVGWLSYDPTFGVPQADSSIADRFLLPKAIGAIGRFFETVVPDPVKRGVSAIGRVVVGAMAGAVRWWPATLAALLALGVGLTVRRRGGRRPQPFGPSTQAGRALAEVSAALRPRGRSPWETPSEFLRRIRRVGLAPDLVDDAELVVRTFERERFGSAALSDEERAATLAAASRVRKRSEAAAPRG
ncbi:MAG: DUF3488 and transglutaminase-like domain-containing protein [Actinomycetota bacterium]